MLTTGPTTAFAAAILLLLQSALVQPTIAAKTAFQAQAEAADGVAAAAAAEPDYTCSSTKPCAIGCCGPL